MAKENLIQYSKGLSPAEAREYGRKGGLKSAQVRREKKAIRDIVNEFLEMPITDGALDEIKNLAELKGKNLTVKEAMTAAQLKKALKGDRQSYELLISLGGQTTEQKQDNTFINALNQIAGEVWKDE